ncbi:MAG: permease [Alphaproteobacteria bacterium]|nr:permease [Alphaproteobacteria bacterium]
MTTEPIDPARRNLPILTGQGAFAAIAWTMASPAVVLTFLAVSLDLPIFLAGLLAAIRHAAGTLSDIFLSGAVSRAPRRKNAIAVADIAVAACFLAVVAATIYGNKPLMIAAFVVGIFIIGIIQEVKMLMVTDLISDTLKSESRMRIHYIQMALGGVGAIALAVLAHELMKGSAPHLRHSVVVAIGAVCFIASAVSMMAVTETSAPPKRAAKRKLSPADRISSFLADARSLFAMPWFRRYLAVRMSFVIVGLSVPFFALIAADLHHTSTRGLTALIISSAAGMIVAAPLWRALNGYSNRAVMLAGTLMIAFSGMVLIVIHLVGHSHDIHLHAASLFVATVAVTGLSSARSLYFMDIAPKAQRVEALAVSKTIGRIAIIVFSAIAAAIAHTQDTVWAVVAITFASLTAAALCYAYVEPHAERNAGE